MPDYKNDVAGMKESITIQSIGLNMGANLIWSRPAHKNEFITTEFRTGMAVNFMKESLIEYYDQSSNSTQSVMYCFVENDIKLNSDLLFRLGGDSKFSMYSGIGANVSSSFNNQLIVFENYGVNPGVMNEYTPSNMQGDRTMYTGKNVVYGRLYIPIGVTMQVLRHLEVSTELKVGRGIEQVVGGNANTFRTGEFSFGLRYNIQKNKAPSILDFI